MIGQSPTPTTADGLPPTPEDVVVDAPAVDAALAIPSVTTGTPPREFGGRDGPEPTRYGDWEKNGRCIDF